MTTAQVISKPSRRQTLAEVAISLGLFLLALLPRAVDLQRFVTADEAKWVYRSAQFWAAFLNGDFAATSVNLTPAVTTTWLGGLGLAGYYWLNQATFGTPFTGWLLSLPEFRAELPVLVATRWVMVLFTSLAVVAIYWLAKPLLGRWLALIAAALVALDPHTVALSRILGHDAPAALFVALSLLLLLWAVKRGEEAKRREDGWADWHDWALFALSGAAAGLAFLSKAPALFLVPFAGLLLLVKLVRRQQAWTFWVMRFLIWGISAYLAFVLFWPAAWVNPVEQPWAVVENAFISATDQEEADDEGYWLVPDLGTMYYLVNGGFKLSPLVLVGVLIFVVLAVANARSNAPPATLWWLLAFAALFTIFITLGDKRSSRYILPVFPPLVVVAAAGWLMLFQVAGCKVVGRRSQLASANDEGQRTRDKVADSRWQAFFGGILIVSAAAIAWSYAPYYFTYFNPLLGGAYTAPHIVKIGWGEGLDQVGRYLQRELSGSRVGAAYASTVAPYFQGDLSAVTGDKLDYLVLYNKQVQSGEPSPEFIRYFRHNGSIFTVNLAGIHYADVYPGPALQFVDHAAGGESPWPVSFRPLTTYGHIGQPLEIDVVWPAADPLPDRPVTVKLTGEDSESLLTEGSGPLVQVADGLVVSRHSLPLPDGLARGLYKLWADDKFLGQVELRRFETPDDFGRVEGVVFDNQIALTGYQWEPSEDFISVTAAWQAQQSRLPDYTVFVQLLDLETGQRVAGVDTPPQNGEWPTNRWVKGEVVIDKYLVAIPYDLPPGPYVLIMGLYRPETGQRLTLSNGQDHWLLPWTYIWGQENN